MDIRNMQAADLDAVAGALVVAYGEGWTHAQAKSYLAKFFGFEPESCLVAIDGGAIAGAVLGYSYPREADLVLFVQELFVRPDARSKGIGRALVTQLRARFTQPKVNIKPLVKAPPNVHSFYNQLGFEREQAFTFYDE